MGIVIDALLLRHLGRLHCILNPLDFRKRPNTSYDLPIHKAQRHGTIISRIPRPGKIITADIDMTFGYLKPKTIISH